MAMKPYLNSSKVDRLRAISPHLFFEWDSKENLWTVKEKIPNGKKYHVTKVCDEHGKYLSIDNRLFDRLKKGDQAQYRTSYESYARMVARRDKILKKREEEKEEMQKDIIKETVKACRRRVFVMGG